MAASGPGKTSATSTVTSDEKSIPDQKFFDLFFDRLGYLLKIFALRSVECDTSGPGKIIAYSLNNDDLERFQPDQLNRPEQSKISLCKRHDNPMLTLFGDIKTARAAHNILQRIHSDLILGLPPREINYRSCAFTGRDLRQKVRTEYPVVFGEEPTEIAVVGGMTFYFRRDVEKIVIKHKTNQGEDASDCCHCVPQYFLIIMGRYIADLKDVVLNLEVPTPPIRETFFGTKKEGFWTKKSGPDGIQYDYVGEKACLMMNLLSELKPLLLDSIRPDLLLNRTPDGEHQVTVKGRAIKAIFGQSPTAQFISHFYKDTSKTKIPAPEEINLAVKQYVDAVPAHKSILKAVNDRNYSVAFRKCCAAGSKELIELFLKYKELLKIDVNEPSKTSDKTPLDYVADKENREELTQLLLDNGAIKRPTVSGPG